MNRLIIKLDKVYAQYCLIMFDLPRSVYVCYQNLCHPCSYIIYKRQNLQNLKCLLPSLHSLAHSCSRKLMQSLQSTGTPNFYPIFTLSTPNTNLKCSPFFARLWRTLGHVCQLFVSILWLMGLWWPLFFWVKDETAFWFVCLHKS